MNAKIKKFLEFNGKAILFLSVDGQYWIAIKPICEALGVNYNRQFKNLKNHKILRDVLAVQPMHDTINRVQNMVALPEKYIYGWLFGISSGVDALQEYQFKCFEILYDYFHGTIGQRHSILSQKARDEEESHKLEAELKDNKQFIRLQELKGSILRSGKELKSLDEKLVDSQLSMFNQNI